MPITTVSNVLPVGEVSSQHGTFYKFSVTLEDGTRGDVLAKNESPWFQVGSEVNYEVTGNYKGTNKLKLGKPDFAGKPFGSKPAAPKPVQSIGSAVPAVSRPSGNMDGPILGMCFKMAVDHYRAKGGDELNTQAQNEIIKATLFFKKIYEALLNSKPAPTDEDAPF